MQRAEQPDDGRVRLQAVAAAVSPRVREWPDTGDPGRWVTDLHQRRQPFRPTPGPVEQFGATGVLDGGDEALALLVLAELGLEPDQLLEQPGRAAGLLATLAQYLAEPGGARDGGGPGPVHGHVTVALEQAHQRLDPVEPLELLGGGHQAERTVVAAAGCGRP